MYEKLTFKITFKDEIVMITYFANNKTLIDVIKLKN